MNPVNGVNATSVADARWWPHSSSSPYPASMPARAVLPWGCCCCMLSGGPICAGCGGGGICPPGAAWYAGAAPLAAQDGLRGVGREEENGWSERWGRRGCQSLGYAIRKEEEKTRISHSVCHTK